MSATLVRAKPHKHELQTSYIQGTHVVLSICDCMGQLWRTKKNVNSHECWWVFSPILFCSLDRCAIANIWKWSWRISTNTWSVFDRFVAISTAFGWQLHHGCISLKLATRRWSQFCSNSNCPVAINTIHWLFIKVSQSQYCQPHLICPSSIQSIATCNYTNAIAFYILQIFRHFWFLTKLNQIFNWNERSVLQLQLQVFFYFVGKAITWQRATRHGIQWS